MSIRYKISLVLVLLSIFLMVGCQNKSDDNKKEYTGEPVSLTADLNSEEKSQKEYKETGEVMSPFGKNELRAESLESLNDPNYNRNIITDDMMKERLDKKGTGFVYFYSPVCPHCKVATPVLWDASEQSDVEFAMYSVWEFENGWADYRIDGTPTLIYYENGKEKDRMMGEKSKQEFVDFLTKYKK